MNTDKNWQLRKDSDLVGKKDDKIIEKILAHRGVHTKAQKEIYIEGDYEEHLHDPFLFKDMERVVERIELARSNQETIGIFGDHDADGVSAATLLADGLENIGIETHVYIPSKDDGHGINTMALDIFHEKKITLMCSVDCGSSNAKEVLYAKERGIDVIIIDHHHLPDTLPEAFAIINPQQEDDTYPFAELSGTGCVFKVLTALYEKIEPDAKDQLKWWLDLVAIATVADCMPLTDENRILVKYGLIVLEKTRRPGLQEMIEIGGIGKYSGGVFEAETIAFQFGPRLNAPGRMKHAKDAYLLLRESDQEMARERAQEVEDLNVKRRAETEKYTKKIQEMIGDHSDKSHLFIAEKDLPIGLLGLIAGKLAHKHKKPTGIFTIEGDHARGSFRSGGNINIIDLLTNSKETLDHFGGHKAAGGAGLKKENLEQFEKEMATFSREKASPSEQTKSHSADVRVTGEQITEKIRDELTSFAPYGMGNAEPLFWITNLTLEDLKFVGKKKTHVKAALSDGAHILDAIGFGKAGEAEGFSQGDSLDLLAYVRHNTWNGITKTQLHIVDWVKNENS